MCLLITFSFSDNCPIKYAAREALSSKRIFISDAMGREGLAKWFHGKFPPSSLRHGDGIGVDGADDVDDAPVHLAGEARDDHGLWSIVHRAAAAWAGRPVAGGDLSLIDHGP